MRQTIVGFSILLILILLVYFTWDKDWVEEHQDLVFIGFIIYFILREMFGGKVVRWIDKTLFGENKGS